VFVFNILTGEQGPHFFLKKGTVTLNIVGKNAWPYKNKMISKVTGSNFNGSHQFV
jgi:hypothetical protein